MNLSSNQLNYKVILSTMAMDVGRKYTTTYLDILDLPGVGYNIGYHILKVVDNKIGPII